VLLKLSVRSDYRKSACSVFCDVNFAPQNGLKSVIAACPKSAAKGRSQHHHLLPSTMVELVSTHRVQYPRDAAPRTWGRRAHIETRPPQSVPAATNAFAHHGLALLDAMDTVNLRELLATMRGLDLFDEKSLSTHMGTALRNRITKILRPVIPEPVKVKSPPKPQRAVKRISGVEKKIAFACN
jgi:hypothetical protein